MKRIDVQKGDIRKIIGHLKNGYATRGDNMYKSFQKKAQRTVNQQNQKRHALASISLFVTIIVLFFSNIQLRRTSIHQPIELVRALILNDLEIYYIQRSTGGLAYVMIEDTKGPYTEEDRQSDPLCYMDDEDLNQIKNVFQMYILSDEKLTKADSMAIRTFFGNFVDRAADMNYIIREFVDEQLYEDANDDQQVEKFQKMLESVGSMYKIDPIHANKWLYLSQA